MSRFHCLSCGDLNGTVGGCPFPWHRVFERVRVAEARVVELEAQLAAVEQGKVSE